jgi:hypothetical protein
MLMLQPAPPPPLLLSLLLLLQTVPISALFTVPISALLLPERRRSSGGVHWSAPISAPPLATGAHLGASIVRGSSKLGASSAGGAEMGVCSSAARSFRGLRPLSGGVEAAAEEARRVTGMVERTEQISEQTVAPVVQELLSFRSLRTFLP